MSDEEKKLTDPTEPVASEEVVVSVEEKLSSVLAKMDEEESVVKAGDDLAVEETENGEEADEAEVEEEGEETTEFDPGFDLRVLLEESLDETTKVTPYSLVIPNPNEEDVDQRLAYLAAASGGIDNFTDNLKNHPNSHMAFVAQQNLATPVGYDDECKVLNEAVKRGDNISTRYEGTEGTLAAATVSKNFSISGVDNITRAQALYLSKRKRVRRIPLYNSGFSVTIASPSQNDLRMFYSQVSDQVQVWGRIMGHHSIQFSDYIIKRQIRDLFVSCVRDCNVEGWARNKTLERLISFNDFQVMCWALGTLIYPNGYPYTFVCSHENCTWKEEQTIDLRKLALTNFTKLGFEGIRHMLKETVKTSEVIRYQELLNPSVPVVYDTATWYLKVPTLQEYFETATLFTATVIDTIQDTLTNDLMAKILRTNFASAYSPWVKKIVDDTNTFSGTEEIFGVAMTVTGDDIDEDDEDPWYTKIDKFMLESATTKIAIPSVSCPKCKTNLGGDYPLTLLTPERDFFIMAMRAVETR